MWLMSFVRREIYVVDEIVRWFQLNRDMNQFEFHTNSSTVLCFCLNAFREK
jgi:hypothetical protein